METLAKDAVELRGVVAVGASAGGVEALSRFVAGIPGEFPYAVMVTMHMSVSAPSALAQIIDRAGRLSAVAARQGQRIAAGCIYVAVPDHHLLVAGRGIVVSQGPSENGHRPAINALFRSVALAWGRRAVGILLSGVLDDGVLGLAAIRARGGIALVQQPSDALFPDMPRHALEAGVVDRQAPAQQLAQLVIELAGESVEGSELVPDPRMELENRIAMRDRFSPALDADLLGGPSGHTCPDCNGTLITVSENNFRCQVGHAWTPEALLCARDFEVERALWTAIRSLQEKAKLSRKLALRVGVGRLGDRYRGAAEEAEQAMKVLAQRLSGISSSGGHLDE